jgi:hypothetical protein
MILNRLKILIPLTFCFMSVSVLAQDFSLSPLYGSITLNGGFTPDPSVIAVRAGGSFAASNTDSSCNGYVTSAPTYSLRFEPGSLGLSIYVNADVDTTLLINDPSGEWFCNDDHDELENLNSGVYFSDPESGRYDIWVGVYSEGSDADALLAISEYSEGSWENDLSPTTSVFIPEISLSGGFTPDPYTIDVIAGGPDQASDLNSSCSGYVTPNPTYRLDFSPGSLGLGIYTLAPDLDTTIAIQSPSGSWYCNDDNSNLEYTLNSGYYFSNPESGSYDIYVGTFSESAIGGNATLAITEYSESSWNPNAEPEIPDGEIQFGSKL